MTIHGNLQGVRTLCLMTIQGDLPGSVQRRGPTRLPYPLYDDYMRESTRLLYVFDRLQNDIKHNGKSSLFVRNTDLQQPYIQNGKIMF